MKKLKISYILILVLTLTSLGLGASQLQTATPNIITQKPLNLAVNKISKKESALINKQQSIQSLQSSNTAIDPLTTNVLTNGNFKSVNTANNLPNNFNYGGTGNSNASATYSTNPISGNYSGMMEAQGTNFSSEYNSLSYFGSATPYLNESLTFSMLMNESTDFSNSANNNFALSLSFTLYNPVSFTYDYLYYYLSYGQSLGFGNYSNQLTFSLNQSVNTVTTFTRNISADFVSYFGSLTNFQLQSQFSFSMSVPQYSPLSRFVLDNVSLTNQTSYNYISQGTFEGATNNWSFSNPTSASNMTLSNDTNSNTQSLSMDLPFKNSNAQSNAQFYQYLPSYANYYTDNYTNKEFLNFNWNLFIHNDTNQQAYFQLTVGNQSTTDYLTWYLGSNSNSFQSNYTYISSSFNYSYIYFNATGFNTNQTWNTFNINIYNLFHSLNISDVYISELYFSTNSGTGATTDLNLLVNNLTLTDFPFGDPGFEENYYVNNGSPATGWNNYNYGQTGMTLTNTDVYKGNYALNLTSAGGINQGVYRYLNMLVGKNYFTDFHFKLLNYTNTANSFIDLQFNNSYNIIYLLGGSKAGYTYTNGSYTVYYYVNNFNSLNTWNTLSRNLQQDLNNGFGVQSNWFMTQVTIDSQSSGSTSKIVILFDEMQFFDLTTAPSLGSVSVSTPEYYKSTTVTVSAIDNYVNTINATLFYENGGTWLNQPLTHTSGTDYSSTIPQYSYGTNVNYYVVLSDLYGHSATYNNGGSDYHFQVLDNVKPNLLLIGLNEPFTNGTVVNNTITFYVNGTDAGSGVNYLNINVGNTTTKLTAFPVRYSIDTTKYPNGPLTVSFNLFDKAGNEVTYVLNLSVDNSNIVNINNPSVITTTVTVNPSTSSTNSTPKSSPGYTAIETIMGLIGSSALGLFLTKKRRR